ncbi:hypothetical protein HHI36_013262 [Cryptolaemus montrouzieri]|uniref:Uncharacterized protein n=1 Tax=Cryptolaemus montrouzieri TaxID=559131 RepID=A0ABD2NGV9_9CUCU
MCFYRLQQEKSKVDDMSKKKQKTVGLSDKKQVTCHMGGYSYRNETQLASESLTADGYSLFFGGVEEKLLNEFSVIDGEGIRLIPPNVANSHNHVIFSALQRRRG